MKLSFNWLKEYIDIPLSPKALADKLSLAGQEIESVTELGAGLKGVVTGRIESIEKHPDADKLVITQISDGKSIHQIVTGATNIAVGDIVPVSLPGAVLANGLKIKESKLRGVPSNGMLCSETELGVSESSEGIWILPADTPLGLDFIQYANLHDTLLELAILPNRGDCQSVLGIVREISVLLNLPARLPDATITETASPIAVSIQNDVPTLCSYYSGRVITGIKNQPSPLWMQRRLQLAGLRPIDLIVDVTNYVLLEYGQPLHAFDLNRIRGRKVHIRLAHEGESFTTLDEKTYRLTASDLLICDGQGPVALAGIMGGKGSETQANTTDILLEAAVFDGVTVRQSAKRLDLRTESAMRFEKGLDMNRVMEAANRAAHLLQQLGGATVTTSPAINQPGTVSTRWIPFDADQINRLLGSSYSGEDMISLLEKLGFGVETGDDGYRVSVPSWRLNDVIEWPCLAEEIARIKGLDDIAVSLSVSGVTVQAELPLERLSRQLEDCLIHSGFYQTCTLSMIAPSDFEKAEMARPETVPVIQNPISADQSVMRSSLFASLMTVLSNNQAHGNGDVQIFEIAKVFGEKNSEKTHLMALAMGRSMQDAYTPEHKAVDHWDIFRIKGLAESVLHRMAVPTYRFEVSQHGFLHPKQQLNIVSGDTRLGYVGMVHPRIQQNYDLSQSVFRLCLDLDLICALPSVSPRYKAWSKYPSTRRDVSLLFDKSLSYAQIEAVIQQHKPECVQNYFVFDLYESDSLGADKRTVSIGFVYQDFNRTLSVEEVNTMHGQFCNMLTQNLPVSIR